MIRVLSGVSISFNFLFRYVKKGGIYIIEDFKHPNYYGYNKNIDHILVDQMLTNLKEKNLFNSNIVSKNDQIYFHENIEDITIYKGNLELSDICFIKKK